MDAPASQPNGRFWPGAVGVLLFAAVLFAAQLGTRSFWSEEVRWAEVPREMERTGHYFWPTINGQTYYGKPLGSYWLVLLAAQATGTVDERAARLPCAVAGWLGVLLVMLIARRLYGNRAGPLAGIVLATSFSFVFFSRHASTDMETVTGVLAALWLFLRCEERPDGWWVLLLWLVMALTSLTKGLLGFALPLLILTAYRTCCPPEGMRGGWSGRLLLAHRWLFNWKSLLAIPLAVLVYLSPFLVSYRLTGANDGLALMLQENVGRFVNPVNHRGPVYLYAWTIFVLLAPWSVLLPAALWQAHRCWRADRAVQSRGFALVYFWAVFVFFTLSASRRSYYLLPVLPAAALLIAQLLVQRRESLGTISYRLLLGGFIVLAVAVGLGGSLLLPPSVLPAPWDQLPGLPAPWLYALGWLGCGAAVVLALRRFTPANGARALALVAGFAMMYTFLVVLPAMEPYRTRKTYADAVRQHLGDDLDSLALFRHREVVYYLRPGGPIPEFSAAEALLDAAQQGRTRWVIARQSDLELLGPAPRVLVCEASYPWEEASQKAAKLVLIDLRND